jgi:hypothetical protein
MERANGALDWRSLVEKLAMETGLDGVDLRVCLYLFARLDSKLYTLVEQREIAEALGRHKEHISRSMRKLKAKNIIIEAEPRIGRSGSYALNQKYGK